MHFKDNVYNFDFFVFFRNDPKLVTFKKKHNISSEDLGMAETQIVLDSPHLHSFILVTFSPKFKNEDIYYKTGVIAHEAYHATELSLFFLHGCTINLTTVNEHVAYYVGFVTENLAKSVLSLDQPKTAIA